MPITDPAVIIVNDKYAKSVELADAASSRLSEAAQAFNSSVYSPAQISVQWQSLPAPNLPPIPNLPALPTTTYTEPGGKPGAFSATLDDVQIDDFDITVPTLNFGVAPTVNIGQVPTLPTVRDVAIPDAPDVTLPTAPQFLALQTHTFAGINLHEDWLDKLDEIPELSILQPTPFSYSPGAAYASQLLDNLKAQLNARIQGGTGLAPAVEQGIWDRSRDRETQIALAREQEVIRGAEALGFPLPSGVLAGQLQDARREYHDKLSGLSRDIAIKQAELEQANVKDSIAAALQLETALMDALYKTEALALDAAKALADNAIAAHASAVEHFKALLAGYQAYASAYDTIIKAEMAKIEVFKALLSAEQSKADINKSLVERYKAEIEGSMAVVQIYQARVGAAKTLVELESTRVQAGAEQIKAFVATVNAETSKVELYKATISAETAKVGAVEVVARAYGAKVGAQAEKARVNVAKYQAMISAKGLEWDGWKTQIASATARVESAARLSSITIDGYRAGATAAEAQAGAVMRQWESNIKQYEASKELTFRVAKANADAVAHAQDMNMEANKVSLATQAQSVASAWAMVSASADVKSSMNYNYAL